MTNRLFLLGLLPESWLDNIEQFLDLDKLVEVGKVVSILRKVSNVYPPKSQVFTAYNKTDFDDVKIVILGQDPYINENEAHGLSFSVRMGKTPPSLKNILKEIENDVYNGLNLDADTNLTRWADQGVFLLNTVLTVEKSRSKSHSKLGWQDFTKATIEALSKNGNNIIFMLWGGDAKNYKKLIDLKKHHVLESGHPSPMSANRGYWFGNRHFSKANEILKTLKKKEIKW